MIKEREDKAMKRNNNKKYFVWIPIIAMVLSLSMGVFFVSGDDATGETGLSTTDITKTNDTYDGEEGIDPLTPNVFTVRFVTNGGSGVSSQHIYKGDRATRPADPTKAGYVFQGWYIDEALTIPYDFNTPVTYHITLHAKWNGISYVIKYDGNGGTGTMADQQMQYGTMAALRANTFELEDHEFAGWSLTRGGEVAYADEEIVSNLVGNNGGSITLYAVWAEKTRTVVFYISSNSDWGDVTRPVDNWVSGSAAGPVGSEAVANAGYHFVKWTNEDGSTIDTSEATITGNKIVPTNNTVSDTTYIAHFAPNTDTAYSIRYYRQMITGGYELFKTENATGTTGERVTADIINVGNGFFHNPDVYGSRLSGVVQADGSLVLSVFYDRERYTVIWEDEDGTEIDRQVGVPYGSVPTFDGETPEKADADGYTYEFNGWTPDFAPVTGDVTYTAVYTKTPIVYHIEYQLFGGEYADGERNPETYTVEDDDITLVNPVKEGSTFLGWSGTEVVDMSQNVTIPSGSTGDRVYLAAWIQSVLGPGDTENEITPTPDPEPEPGPGEDIEIPPEDGGNTPDDGNKPGDTDKPNDGDKPDGGNKPDGNTPNGGDNKPDGNVPNGGDANGQSGNGTSKPQATTNPTKTPSATTLTGSKTGDTNYSSEFLVFVIVVAASVVVGMLIRRQENK